MARNRKPGTGDYTNGHFDEYERAHRRDGVMWKVLTGLMILTLGVLVLMDLLLPPQKGGFETEPEAPKAIARDELGALERPSIPLRLLTTPRNLCIARGKLWVVGDKRLCRVNPDQGGSEPWSLNLDIEPMAVAVDEATGTCYIAATDHVRVYDSTGKRLAVWPAVDPKSQLLDIEVNNQGDVFVADYGMRAVYRYTLDGMMVNKIGVVGETYKTVPGIVLPSPYFDMVLSKVGGRYDGLVRLTNTGKLRVDTYTYDGYFEMSFGRSGQSERDFYGCCNPVRIAQLPDGNFVTAEKGVQRLKEYSPGGVFLRVLANRHTLGTDRSELALAAGADGTIYLLDENESKIRVFLRKRPAGAAASSRPVIQPKPLPRAESKPEPKIEPKPEPKEEPKPALKPEPKPAPKTPIFLEPEPKPKAVPTRLPDPARLTDPIFFDPAEASQEKSKPIVIPKPAPVPAPAPAFK
ncbi:MAG: hypothetical protein HN909_01655, partial [Phycisphaerales bacterium]|nr:hypothetical protein [Phycisphaerales bacterium]